MRKVMLVTVVVTLLAVNMASAQDKVSTFVDFRNDYIMPEKGDDQYVQAMAIWWQYKSFGTIIETSYADKTHSSCLKPSLLWKVGKSYYMLGGVSTDSNGSKFVQTGVWYINKLGKASVYIDLRNYWIITGRNNGYTDNLFRVMYPVGKGFSVGADLIYDHWWKESSHNWYFVGSRLSYKINAKASVYARVSREWNVRKSGSVTTDKLRLGLTFSF